MTIQENSPKKDTELTEKSLQLIPFPKNETLEDNPVDWLKDNNYPADLMNTHISLTPIDKQTDFVYETTEDILNTLKHFLLPIFKLIIGLKI